MSDGLLHLYRCEWLLRPAMEKRCGHVVRGDHGGDIEGNRPFCPFDHGEQVRMVPLTATALCSGCGVPVEADDGRTPDGRLICPECCLQFVAVEISGECPTHGWMGRVAGCAGACPHCAADQSRETSE